MAAIDAWLFGIDGGGTSSRIRVEDLDGAVLFEHKSGSTNLASNPAHAVEASLRRLFSAALASGLDPGACRAGFIGSAGVDRIEDRAGMEALVASAFKAEASSIARDWSGGLPAISVGNDAEPALAGALADVQGFLLIAGTGSIAFGRTREGRTARAGGWGHLLGDEGSAFWIAFQAIRHGIRSLEGREPPSRLLEAALGHFGLPDAPSLIPFAYKSFDKALIAGFAPVVAGLARSGDEAAAAIMEQAARELAGLVFSVRRALAPREGGAKLAILGGLLANDGTLRERVLGLIVEADPRLEPVSAKGDAAAGACRLARESLR